MSNDLNIWTFVNCILCMTSFFAELFLVVVSITVCGIFFQVRVGDKVLLPQYGGVKVPLEENKDYFLFRETDVIAKLES